MCADINVGNVSEYIKFFLQTYFEVIEFSLRKVQMK